MDVASEIAQMADAAANNAQQIIFGTENVNKYKAQLEQLFELERELATVIRPRWDESLHALQRLLDEGKYEWHGERRDTMNDMLDDRYFNAMRKFYEQCIAPNWRAIQNRIDALQEMIEHEEGIIAKLARENEDIKSRKTQLEGASESEEA